jgi:hypothetical protein
MQTPLELRMRNDIRPLCKAHHTQMVGPLGRSEMYVCEVPGCGVRWRAVTEYQKVLVPEVLLVEDRLIPCPHVGHGHMFLAAIDKDRGVEVWQCSIDGCAEQVLV